MEDFFKRLKREIRGEVLWDRFSRGLYSTDASFYQIEPLGVAVPRDEADVEAVIAMARQEGIPVVPRGAGTSQGGQVLGRALIIDASKYLDRLIETDVESRTAVVEPGIVLDRLNALLRPQGLFFPVDPATSSRATLGGMAGNNSSGSRSVRYGIMADNVRAVEAVLADGERIRFGEIPEQTGDSPRCGELVRRLREIHAREAEEIERRVPKVLRHVAGYNLHRLSQGRCNLAELLVGSEGTLAFFTRLELALQPIPAHRVLGVCHFPTFYAAMQTTPALVELGASAVELFDRTLIDLGRQSPLFSEAFSRFVRGDPQALLLVEFSGPDRAGLVQRLDGLEEAMSEKGFPNAVVRAEDDALQQEIWRVRKSGLNIVTAVKGPQKPVAFIEDCTIPLPDLAEYSAGLLRIFERHHVRGTFYGHASVGCLHVRPMLNLREEAGVKAMRAIAEETHELVRRFGGSHSGEHGDGLVRSEFIEPMLGKRLATAFEEVKSCFDPQSLFNPGKIVHAPRMDDRNLFRFAPGYGKQSLQLETVLDWSKWGGLLDAAEMCNNNGACRKLDAEVMCPSFRATRDERHLTRGRANTLRLALSGQLGPDALTSDEMQATLDLCISCKACRSECPMGVDMARMKIEMLHRRRQRHGLPLHDRLMANLPRYASYASRLAPLLNLRNRSRTLAWLGETLLGLNARRRLPAWRRRRSPLVSGNSGERTVVLLADTFNTWFEPENLEAALRVLETAGCQVIVPLPPSGRPLCCGRTFLSMGMVDEARREIRRTLDALRPFAQKGIPVLGLEPSCLLTLRDEFPALLPGDDTEQLAAQALLLEEFLAREVDSGRIELPLGPLPTGKILFHGHCHQKAFSASAPALRTLHLIPGVEVEAVQSSCCGMAGSFGYDARHYDLSMKMAELSLLPTIRQSDPESWIAADGFSCRHQIVDGTGRQALHVAQILARSLNLDPQS